MSKTSYADNSKILLDGRTARVIADRERQAITEGRDVYGSFLRFTTEKGDRSANDAPRYGAGKAPKRAFVTIESMGNVARWGRTITQDFGLVVEPGPMIREKLFVVFAQENAYPEDGKSWRSPPMEFGLLCKGRTRVRDDGKVVGVKDEAGKLIRDEFLYLEARTDEAGRQVEACKILSKTPIRRGDFYKVSLAYVDGGGEEEGRAAFRINGMLQGPIFKGRTGYRNFRSPYPAVGVYCHVGQVSPLSVRVYGWTEGPAA